MWINYHCGGLMYLQTTRYDVKLTDIMFKCGPKRIGGEEGTPSKSSGVWLYVFLLGFVEWMKRAYIIRNSEDIMCTIKMSRHL